MDPEGLNASYNRVQNFKYEDVLEKDFKEMQDQMVDSANNFMNTISKEEQEVMTHTKNFALRLRLDKSQPLDEDFRKKIMTREYGNYEKYSKNKITTVTEPS